MVRTVGIGYQNYQEIIEDNAFYIDKTLFIKEWWENLDRVTLITRPRRFGKTLNMSMIEQFFSIDYADCSNLFEKMKIWKEEKYHGLQGKFPVISLSFANVKENTFETAKIRICQILSDLNNLEVVTTTSDKYVDIFGFTQDEVSEALEEFGLSDMEECVRNWYDGFSFRKRRDIYNPMSLS